jgi:hypothetical protein
MDTEVYQCPLIEQYDFAKSPFFVAGRVGARPTSSVRQFTD